MGDLTRRRTILGTNRSAALPLLWEACAQNGWSDAQLAKEMEEETSIIARLVYGDRKANRPQAAKLFALFGIPLEAWDQPTKLTRRKHIAPTSGVDVAVQERVAS